MDVTMKEQAFDKMEIYSLYVISLLVSYGHMVSVHKTRNKDMTQSKFLPVQFER